MDAELSRPSPKPRAKFVFGGAIVFLALLGLVGWAMNRPQATAFYLDVGEIQAMGSTPAGEEVRVNGKVVDGSIDRDGLRTTFAIVDGDREMLVSTDQPLPDAFRDASEVVARGSYDGEVFRASQVLAKCPSKFEAA